MKRQTKIIKNYRVIIKPEIQVKEDRKVYTVFCPTLGVADWGKTIEEALKNIKEGIEVYLESLVKHNQSIPEESLEEEIIAPCQVELKIPETFVLV